VPLQAGGCIAVTDEECFVRQILAENIVNFLSYSPGAAERVVALSRFNAAQWQRTLSWMDDAGLALYFLHKLRQTKSTNAIPDWVLARLERNLVANRQRVNSMSRQFGFLNKRFHEAGVRYAAMKGFSLVPEFCPDASLRHQGDFDYLIDEASAPVAQQALVKAGYVPKRSHSSKEFIYVKPSLGEPRRDDKLYEAQAPHAVELHLDTWDSEQTGLRLTGIPSFLEKTITREWNGLTFPSLNEEDAFLFQVMHACHHLFDYWIRMSWLFEVAYFLNRRAPDARLWNRIQKRVGDNALLREFVVLITDLAARLFNAPLPPALGVWHSEIRREARVWLENYARSWVFSEIPAHQFRLLPRAKLVLFLQQQYAGNAQARHHFALGRVFSVGRLVRIAHSINDRPSLALNKAWWKRQLLARRSLFHLLAGLRYLCEVPRWWWLNRRVV
jgi:Uncharacterised nucleotidyltransferase